MKKLWIAIAILVALGAVSLGLFFIIRGRAPQSQPGQTQLTLSREGQADVTLSLAQIEGLPSAQFSVTQGSGGKPGTEVTYTGADVLEVFNYAYRSIAFADDATITFIAQDGYAAAFTYGELKQGGCVVIVYRADGQALDAGGKGPLMAVAAKEAFANRNTGMLIQIKIGG